MSNLPPDLSENNREGTRSARRVVVALILGSIAIGAIAFWRYRSSEVVLTRARIDIEAKGPTLSPPECVESVVDWARHCEAMKTLCDASMPRMTKTCVEAADRRAYCDELGRDAWMSARFGYDECERLGVDRTAMKACALAYRSIANHCETLAGEAPKESP
ncbi:MAG: hypothetical protein IT350_14425 [Deltaproteobacteria bacterium]|nr:hypothetical protein [Deltaproteobacteria bacterium]